MTVDEDELAAFLQRSTPQPPLHLTTAAFADRVMAASRPHRATAMRAAGLVAAICLFAIPAATFVLGSQGHRPSVQPGTSYSASPPRPTRPAVPQPCDGCSEGGVSRGIVNNRESALSVDTVANHYQGPTQSRAPKPSVSSGTYLPAKYLGALRAAYTYPSSSISLRPPLTQQPTVRPVDVYPGLCMSGAAVCDTSSAPTITLALATIADAGTQNPDGTLTPLVNNALVYVITWDRVSCAPVGGIAKSSAPATHIATTMTCRLVNFVDATTGKFVYATEG
jgi:hypothetical protein